ncbi:3396_t:CDS:2, partial [Rhizophagus irregularis]
MVSDIEATFEKIVKIEMREYNRILINPFRPIMPNNHGTTSIGNSSSSSTNAQETSSFASKKRTTKRRIRKNIQTAKEQTKEQHISENPTEYYQNEFYEFYSNMINFPRQGLQNPLTLSSFTLQSLLL